MNQCEMHEQSARSVAERIRFVLVGAALALIVAVCSQFLFAEDAYAANSVQPKGTLQFQVSGTNDQTEARKILSLVNGVRALNYNPNNTSESKTPTAPLTWDYNLEKAAMQRAAEIAILFEHKRPDGTACNTAVDGVYYAFGENIHGDGGVSTATTANTGWTKSPGHYGNMIDGDFTCMGAAKFEVNGVSYWVELFGNPNRASSETAAVNGARTYTISAKAEYLDLAVTIPSALTVPTTKQCSVVNTNKGWAPSKVTINPTSFSWISSNGNIVSVSNSGIMTPKAVGSASIMVKFNNESAYTSQVTVSQKGTSSNSTATKTGWQKGSKGWWYGYSDGSFAKGLTTIGSNKYYFDNNGWMKTGWIHATGNSDWYYFKSNGDMAKGWLQLGKTWYYMNSSGIMQKGRLDLSGSTYFLADNGAMKTGWVSYQKNWYYTNGSGVMQKGWKKLSGKWYYLNTAGVMLDDGFHRIGNGYYYFESNGVMATGWKKVAGAWYYFESTGAAKQNKWLKSGGKWYYFASDYRMCTGFFPVGKDTYYADSSGAMLTGWQKIAGNWRYFASSGALQTNRWISGIYWVGSDGIMAKNEWVDNGRYYVDGNGKWVMGAKK